MAEKASLTEKTGVVVFARIITTVIDLALVVAILHILDKTAFAVIGYLLMVHEVARNLATLGFPESIFYYFERVVKDARKAFVWQTVSILSVLGVAAGLFILVFNNFVPAILSGWQPSIIQTVQQLLPLMALVTVLEVPTWPVPNILLASNRQKEASLYEMLTSGLSFAAVVVPLLLGYSLTFAVYGMIAYAVIRFIGSAIWMFLVLPEGRKKRTDIPLKKQFKFSAPLGISALVGKINRYADKFIVSIFLAATAYAEYTVAAQEIPIVKVIPFAVGSVLISRFVDLQLNDKKEELLALWHKSVRKVSLMVVPLTILIVVVASDLIALLAGSANTSYQNAVIPFQIYNLIILTRVANYGSILQAFGDTKGVLYMSFNLLIANVILTIPLTFYFGIVGAAAGTLIASVYNLGIMLRRISGHMDISVKRLMPYSFYFRVLGISILVGVPVWFSRMILFPDEAAVVGLMFSVIIFLFLFYLAGSLFGVITQKDRRDLKEWLSLKFLR